MVVEKKYAVKSIIFIVVLGICIFVNGVVVGGGDYSGKLKHAYMVTNAQNVMREGASANT